MKCPTCAEELPPVADDESLPAHFPFCSQRCQMIDLGHWFAEDYRISRPIGVSEREDSLPES